MEVKPKDFRVRLAFDSYSVGQIIQPVGLWRSSLLSRGYIEPVVVENPAPVSAVVAGPVESVETEPNRGRNRGKRHDAVKHSL